MKYDLIELCCGLASVSLAATGSSPAPVSRIGSKRGYTGPILEALGIEPGTAKRVLLVDSDPNVCLFLKCLLNSRDRLTQARIIEMQLEFFPDARTVWNECRDAVKKGKPTPTHWLLWTAGARGGVGGFKGAHKLRPNVDGFIPSRKALAERLRKFHVPDGVEFEVRCCAVEDLSPRSFERTCIYLDPPYPERQGYGNADQMYVWCVKQIVGQWRSAGHRVVVSLDRPISGANRTLDITKLRKGQTRRSMTRDSVEWISVLEP